MTDYFLSKGAHTTAKEGRCAMEWVAYLAGEPHSSMPACVSRVLRQFGIALNDSLPDKPRQRLRPYLARMIGTAGDGLDEKRAWMATDWLVRTYTPTWLSLAGLDEAAARLHHLPPVLAADGLGPATGVLRSARLQAIAIWTAARGPHKDSAMAAAWAAGKAAAGPAAWDAAKDAGGGSGWEAAWTARDAAKAAAWESAKDTSAYTAWNALVPTVRELQDSVFVLLDRMLPTIPVAVPAIAEAPAVCELALAA